MLHECVELPKAALCFHSTTLGCQATPALHSTFTAQLWAVGPPLRCTALSLHGSGLSGHPYAAALHKRAVGLEIALNNYSRAHSVHSLCTGLGARAAQPAWAGSFSW